MCGWQHKSHWRPAMRVVANQTEERNGTAGGSVALLLWWLCGGLCSGGGGGAAAAAASDISLLLLGCSSASFSFHSNGEALGAHAARQKRYESRPRNDGGNVLASHCWQLPPKNILNKKRKAKKTILKPPRDASFTAPQNE
ncbi:hypothetical protein ACLKA6_011794 [Drosophila palustris]